MLGFAFAFGMGYATCWFFSRYGIILMSIRKGLATKLDKKLKEVEQEISK